MQKFQSDFINPEKFSTDPENNEFFLLYLGYELKDIGKMNYAKSIRMSKRMQTVIKMGSIHSYMGIIGNLTQTGQLKIEYPEKWKQKKQQKINNSYNVEFDISDVIIK